MPKESTTWLAISAVVGLVPIASSTRAGSIVTVRRIVGDRWRSTKPSMTTCPE